MGRVVREHKCPVCGMHTFKYDDSYDICPECGWEDCAAQERDPADDLGPNTLCLNDYRSDYLEHGRPEWILEMEREDAASREEGADSKLLEASALKAFKKGAESLTEEQLKFIAIELGISAENIATYDDDEMNLHVYEPMFDIEAEETPSDDSELSNRGKLAESIVTVLGNSMADYNGLPEERQSDAT